MHLAELKGEVLAGRQVDGRADGQFDNLEERLRGRVFAIGQSKASMPPIGERLTVVESRCARYIYRG